MGGNHVNKLAGEASPYLLQHAENPVDWHPWGEEAFVSAKEQNKPILLSIGYSTCHWCHVMAHESFEDNEVAALMNEAFIAIKVDREERPDIDNIYMTVCQMMTGRGGWPLTIIMTPDKEPFFAGTYIPKEGRFGQIGLMELIPRMQAAWEREPERIRETVKNIMEALDRAQAGTAGKLDGTHLTKALTHYRATYDSANGGFGGKPKFPAAHQLLFLLRQWKQTGQDDLLGMVIRTLDAMRLGGIYDHVGYGFHRYSTDEKWLVPHFEKMLYDQAMLMMAYTEGYQATGSSNFARTVDELAEYISRDMTSPDGAFFSAEDADSDGEEGKFYVWSYDELGRMLNADEVAFLEQYFQAANNGNFIDELTGKSTGLNILHLRQFLPAENTDAWKTIRGKLFIARENRIRPGLDDKILTDWNGLMIAALAKAGAALGVEQYVTQAAVAMKFMLTTMRRDDGRLRHRYRNGDAGIDGTLEDYAYLGWGLLELYFATFEAKYLNMAMEITDRMIRHFHDESAGGFYFSADDGEQLLIRSKEYYDGAIPSGNSVAAYNLIRLARLTGQSRYEDLAAATCASVAAKAEQSPSAFAWLLATVDFGMGPAYEVVIAGDRDGADTQAMLKALRQGYYPNGVTLLHESGAQGEQIRALSPLVAAQLPIDGKATAYVCQNFTCDRPVTSVHEMIEKLTATAQRG